MTTLPPPPNRAHNAGVQCMYCQARATHGIWSVQMNRNVPVCDACGKFMPENTPQQSDHVQFAGKIADYYMALKQRGLSDEHALDLTRDYQSTILDHASKQQSQQKPSWFADLVQQALEERKKQHE